jgi:hypothetical protein
MIFQEFIASNYEIILLILGLLLMFNGLAPVISRNYYVKNYDTKYNNMFWPFSKRDGYLYDRYIRQIYPILVGLTLVIFSLYQLLFV